MKLLLPETHQLSTLAKDFDCSLYERNIEYFLLSVPVIDQIELTKSRHCVSLMILWRHLIFYGVCAADYVTDWRSDRTCNPSELIVICDQSHHCVRSLGLGVVVLCVIMN